jgi:hypothetical protein
MGLASGPEVVLDAEMEFYVKALEPAATASGKGRWFLDLIHSKHTAVELPKCWLAARRAGQLNMVDHVRLLPSYLDMKISSLVGGLYGDRASLVLHRAS